MKKKGSKEDSGAVNKGNWKEFGAFFKYAHLNWGWIAVAAVVTVIYYLTCTKLPGSTAALFSGNFSNQAITDLVINFASLMLMMMLVSIVSLIAEARSVRSVRRAVWTRMMGIRADYYDEHSAAGLFSAITSDTEVRENICYGCKRDIPTGEAAQVGDTVILKVSSEIPRYNKEKVTATLGRGLYSKDLEEALIAHTIGDTVTVMIQEKPVSATLLEIKRKQVPEPTDEMVQALEAKTSDGKPITTVQEYEDYIRTEKVMTVLANINFYVCSAIMEDIPALTYDEDDIRVLGELEKAYFIEFFLKTQNIDIREGLPKEWKQEGVETLDDFIAARREWYTIKIKQCLMFLNILDLPCTGATDPLDHYEVLQELQMKIFDLIKAELERRKTK